jgi:hypothetical protein
MKFGRKPIVGTVRKRFAWLPHRMFEMRGKWIATGHPDIPYKADWMYNQFGHPPVNLPAHRGMRNRVQTPTTKSEGGMVTPVRVEGINWYDHWIWFDWYLQMRESNQIGLSGKTFWRHFAMPEQWNLWHEYE